MGHVDKTKKERLQVPIESEDQISLSDSESKSFAQLDVDFALTIHQRVMTQLKPPTELSAYLFHKSGRGLEAVARRLGRTAAAVRQEVCRLRRKHWQGFRDEVAQ